MSDHINPPPSLNLMTEPEMAQVLKVQTRTMRYFRSRRYIPFIKLGGAVRYDPADVRAALERLTIRARP